MKLIKNIKNQIQINHVSNLDVRAKYLHSLYQPISKKLANNNKYLDIGCGFGVNSQIFGEQFDSIYCSDYSMVELGKCEKCMPEHGNVFYVAADAQSLPFKGECFDLVTAFSLIEHVPDQEQMLKEALRLLTKYGTLVIQFPNRYFFMELHSGIPFCYLIPDFAKPWASKKFGYPGLAEINLPKPKKIKKIIAKIDASMNVTIIRVVYPTETIPPKFRKFYTILTKIGIFKFIPFGWMVICEK